MPLQLDGRSWLMSSGGRLPRAARLRFATEAVARQAVRFADPLRRRTGMTRAAELLDADRPAPDSRMAREVTELAECVVPEPLLGHSLRTWLWGALLACHDGLGYDEELLYVSALLHDIGLTDRYRPREHDGAECFAVHGAAQARAILNERGWDPRHCDDAADAIALHMNNVVAVESGVEVHLLHAGAHLDVVGLRARDLPKDVCADVVARFPRADFASCFTDLMRREARDRPHSRAGVLWRLGMRVAIARNCFPASTNPKGQ